MNRVRVAAAILNQTPLAWDGNVANVLGAIDDARRDGVQVLCLPEMCLTGYGCEDAFLSQDVIAGAREVLREVLPATADMVVSLGLPVLHRNRVYNGACLCVDGRIAGVVPKRYLAASGIHYEPRWFTAWPEGRRSTIDLLEDDERVPIGDLQFDVGGLRIGFEICEDAWVASRPGRLLAQRGIDLILNPSASHFAFGKLEVRRGFVVEGSRAFACGYVYSNLLGNESGRAIYDGGALIASGGTLLATGPRLGFVDRAITSAVIDVARNRMNQATSAEFVPETVDVAADEVRVAFAHADPAASAERIETADWETSATLKEEEFTRAVALGLFDYVRKSRSWGFCVSLSGGADSAAVACLVALSVRLGTAELGRKAFLEKLAHVPKLGEAADERAMIARLLTCAYQATANSSERTREAARAVADGIGATFHVLDVDALVQGYIALGESALGRPLTWETDDLALQNVQARVRAPSIWLLANVRNALLLATSNRSEAAVGYATMDGDTAGGVSPIAGIDKAFLREWLRWLEADGPRGLGPVPSLAAVNAQTPTAELRPQESFQTDEDDLMPYDLLDAIERAAIRDKKGPVEVLRVMRAQFGERFEDAQLVPWIERFFKLWCRNQWKRERYAPSFHLDDANLDPKTWCRFPILSGGFERELRALRDAGEAPA